MPYRTFRIYTFRLLFLLQVAFLFSSCVKEDMEECTSDFQLIVNILDKEYSNADELPEIVTRAIAPSFDDYVDHFGYELVCVNTARTLPYSTQSNISVDDSSLSIPINDWYEGSYRITAWGNYPSNTQAPLGCSLNSEELADEDIYFCLDTIQFSQDTSSAECFLYRTKGKLIIFVENLTDSVYAITANISSVYGYVNQNFEYGQATDISKTSYSSFQNLTVIESKVSPTPEGQFSAVSLTFYSRNTGEPFYTSPPIEVTIRRNEITLLGVALIEGGTASEIKVWIENRWETVQYIDITE